MEAWRALVGTGFPPGGFSYTSFPKLAGKGGGGQLGEPSFDMKLDVSTSTACLRLLDPGKLHQRSKGQIFKSRLQSTGLQCFWPGSLEHWSSHFPGAPHLHLGTAGHAGFESKLWILAKNIHKSIFKMHSRSTWAKALNQESWKKRFFD